MITIDSVLSKKNIQRAFDHLNTRHNGQWQDTYPDTEVIEFWQVNGERVMEEIRACKYQPGPVTQYEILNGKGKRRIVTKLTEVDRLITRLLSQKLNSFFNPMFLSGSHAYQENKGVLSATEQARDYIEQGYVFVAETDISNYFDEINLERLFELLKEKIEDEAVLALIRSYLYCTILADGVVTKRKRGIVQGSSISPVLANLYLHSLDCYLTEKDYHWIRFADDLNIYVPTMAEGETILSEITSKLKEEYDLPINEAKSGVFDVFERRFLGYDFVRRGRRILVNRHIYEKKGHYREWHPCAIERVNREYHIIKEGVLNKKDYALLFENKEEKHHIPVEATEQINLYNEIMLSSSVLATISKAHIRLSLLDRFGNLLGHYTYRILKP